MSDHPLDLAGIGIGPFNLSLAAQLDAVGDLDARFFDRAPAFDWHPGMMLPDVALQTSFLKDLVTAVNPTSPWSFLAYLVAQKRFYEFLNAEFEAVPLGVGCVTFLGELALIDESNGISLINKAVEIGFYGGERYAAHWNWVRTSFVATR